MPSFQNTSIANFWKRILQLNQTSNTGVDTTTRNIQSGDGTNTSTSLSDDVLQVQPANDNTTATLRVNNSGGSAICAVDTTNSKVLVGASQVAATTQYANFGVAYNDNTGSAAFAADTHYAIPFMTMNYGSVAANMTMGSSTSSSFNDTEPASSLTISNTAMDRVVTYWYVMDNITIDRVVWWQGADTATGDSTCAYLMGYDVDASTGSTGGDLSNGTKLCSSSTVTNAGYEQAYYNQMTIHSANVDAGQVILFTFASDTVNSDYTLNATIKYHIR